MPVSPKVKYAVSVDVQTYRLTDITGEYSASNTGGWGSPNADLAQSALVFAVNRKASTGDAFMSPVASQVVFNALATNATVTEVDFEFSNDGVLEMSLLVLPASGDGVTYLSGPAIAEGDYFYWSSAGNLIWQMVDSAPVAITDYNSLVGLTGDIIQVTEEDILLPQLAVKKQALYKEYRLERDKQCDRAKKLFDELLRLSQNIQGAIYAFYSELTVEAQDQVESMLEEYQL
jgi:hypothetical protein